MKKFKASNFVSRRLNRKNFSIGLFGLMFVMALIGSNEGNLPYNVYIVLFFLIILPSFLMLILLFVRRFHDINKQGANIFWFIPGLIIPIINIILLFVILRKGDEGENAYGKPTKNLTFFEDILGFEGINGNEK